MLWLVILKSIFSVPPAVRPQTLKLPANPQSTQNQKIITNSYVGVYDSPSNLPQTLKLPANPKSTQNQLFLIISVVLYVRIPLLSCCLVLYAAQLHRLCRVEGLQSLDGGVDAPKFVPLHKDIW